MLMYCIFVVLCIIPNLRGEDSLKSAMNAVDRRHRDITTTDYRPYGIYDLHSNLLNSNHHAGAVAPQHQLIDEDGYGVLTSDDSAFSDGGNTEFEKALLDFLEEKGVLERDNYDGRISPFRERVEEDKHKQHERIVQILHDREDEEHAENLRKLFDKYRKQYLENYQEPTYDVVPNKRAYYPNLGYGSVGMTKRSRYFEPDGPSDSLLLLNYAPRDELFNRDQTEDDVDEVDDEFEWNRPQRQQYVYHLGRNRNPIAKRSSEYTESFQKTDPKVEKDLNDIFNPKNNTNNGSAPLPPSTISKEIMPKLMPPEKPMDIKKKSVDWSKYFGLDRRKKTDDEMDKDWLIERYQKTKSNNKRNMVNPTLTTQIKNDSKPKLFGKEQDDTKIKDMDQRLKNIEESIVDDTLKYTGAHEGTIDSKELQAVKDRIISRLAAAYSLEKMRRALGEYKDSLAKASNSNNNDKDNEANNGVILEDKRASVARKQAVDHDRVLAETEETNKIKCSHGDEDCEEQNFKAPKEFLDQDNWNKEGCPMVLRACDEVSSVLGPYGKVINHACIMHQMCLLCGDNSWFTPTRQCNVLFLSKADELCGGDQECERVSRVSVRYLLHVNRSLRSEPLHDCDLSCPQV